jgi:TPR repeat protein
LRGAVHYFQLASHHRTVNGVDYSKIYPPILTAVSIDFRDASIAHHNAEDSDSDSDSHLKHKRAQHHGVSQLSASANARSIVAWMSENGIGTHPDLVRAAQLYERSSVQSGIGAASFGWCLRTGKGVPIDLTLAAEFFQIAADFGDPDGANSLGVCLELGEGIEADIDLAVWYYEIAAADSHADGMYNFGRCLEFGKGIGRDPLRAAKYYRLAADRNRNHGAAQNSFGMCLERGIGVQQNQALAVEYYQRSANNGHPDGANNIGFCLEHGRCVTQNIKLAAQYYKFAADCGHAEALINYRRCLRLFGKWEIPDRSNAASRNPPSRDDLAKAVIACLDDRRQFDAGCDELIASIQRLKLSRLPPTPELEPAVEQLDGTELWRSESAVVRLARATDGSLTAVKTAAEGLIEREAAIHRELNHPLIIAFREFNRGSGSIVTEFAGNRRLSAHLPPATGDAALRGPNKIGRIVIGIAFAMRYLHSCGVIHRDLTPDKVLLDWDWNVRIADFGHSGSQTVPYNASQNEAFEKDPSRDWRYTAPECFVNDPCFKSDVFSFGMILYELLVGIAVFPKDCTRRFILKMVAVEGYRPTIPDWIGPKVADLITDCWAQQPDDRPGFWRILERLAEMDFKLMPDVKSAKMTKFFDEMTAREKAMDLDL